MPQRGSRLAISSNATLPRGQSKEWYSAMARWNLACAASVQDTEKCTSPSPSDLVGPSRAPARSAVPATRDTAMMTARYLGVSLIGGPPCERRVFGWVSTVCGARRTYGSPVGAHAHGAPMIMQELRKNKYFLPA